MNKVIYPREGLYIYCQADSKNIKSDIDKSKQKCNFTIPEGFSDKAYLMKLEETLGNFKTEITEIDDVLQAIDKRYETLSDNMESRVKQLEDIKIEYRDRMIK